jgi:hypothetical protein
LNIITQSCVLPDVRQIAVVAANPRGVVWRRYVAPIDDAPSDWLNLHTVPASKWITNKWFTNQLESIRFFFEFKPFEDKTKKETKSPSQ